jgi:hypothetical protein
MAQSQLSNMVCFDYDDETIAVCVNFVCEIPTRRKVETPVSKDLRYTTVRTLSRSFSSHFIP